MTIHPLLYFWLLLKASLFSTGGFGNFPSVHADFLARGWGGERQFAEALAVGQITPGPNGLWVVSLGYLTDGPRGACLAALAVALPPLVVVAVERLYQRVKHHPGVEGFVHGLALAVVGVFAVTMLGLLRRTTGFTGWSIGMALVAGALAASRRVPVPLIILLAAVAGIVNG